MILDIIDQINLIIDFINENSLNDYELPEKLNIDDKNHILEEYEIIKNIFRDCFDSIKNENEKVFREIENEYGNIIKKLNENGINTNELPNRLNRDMNGFRFKNKAFIEENNLQNQYPDFFDKIDNYNILNNRFEYEQKRILRIDELLEDYFNRDDNSLLSNKIMHIVAKNEGLYEFGRNWVEYGTDYNFYLLFQDKNKINAFDYFYENGFIDDVMFVDNISILDFHFDEFDFDSLPLHLKELVYDLHIKKDEEFNPKGIKPKDRLSKITDDKVLEILEKIENVVVGQYEDYGIFDTKMHITEDPTFRKRIKNPQLLNKESVLALTGSSVSSGIKQIGLIQLLLINGKLKRDGYLIIDEPEVNLHPEWQFKFAEILVLLAKDLNITIYLNSHSPFFIESIDAFSQYYDMENDVNYYLTEGSEFKGKYDFIKIESKELYKIYDNLGNAYDLINQLRLRKRLEK